ncbi:MAG: transporter [Acidobacteriota bacterium]
MKSHLKGCFLGFILIAAFLFSAFSLAEEKTRYRLIQLFPEDAAIVPTQWWEAQIRFISDGQYRSANIPDSDTFVLSPIVAFSLKDDLEVGAILSIENIDYDWKFKGDDSSSGIADTDIYVKYRIVKDPADFTLGAVATLPTGDEDEGRGAGKFNVELFGSGRKSMKDFTIAGVFGFRLNRDATILEIDLDAKTSFILGGGIIYPFSDTLAFTGELNIETERYDDMDADIRVTPGIQFNAFKNTVIRGGIGLGLADGAPDFEIIASYVYTF